MGNYHLISVIIPVYNTEKYLSECIDSVLSQTYDNFELILIDDGSKDSSGDICDRYAEQDDRIRVIHQTNSGVSIARNKGINEANGMYIAFIDSDDIVNKWYLEILINHMQLNGMSICKLSEKKEEVFDIHTDNLKTKIYSPKNAMINMSSPPRGLVCGPHCTLFSKEILKANNIIFNEEIAIGEDYLFKSKYLSCCTEPIKEIDSALYYLRPNSGVSIKRFSYKKNIDPRLLSAFKAMKLSADCFDDMKIKELLALRGCKAATDDLRLMTASKFKDSILKKELQSHIRRYLKNFLNSDYSFSAKFSVLLAAISPRIEYITWKIINYIRNKGRAGVE